MAGVQKKGSWGSGDKDPNEKTIEEDLVVTKYKMAGELVNRVLRKVLDKCVKGANIREICEFGDSLLLQETANVFRKEKQMKRGIAFPTSLSVNNCICHFSPTVNDPDVLLQDGDVVKVDLGAHIDGFIAVVAHTVVVGASTKNKVKGRAADAILAAYFASEAALRLLKPGNETSAVTDIVQKVSEDFKCKPVEGMLSHQLKQFKIDGEKTIIQNPNDSQKKEHEKFEFEVNEVYAMDVIISTGEGVGKDIGAKVKIYKKTDEVYQLKLKASRAFFKDVVQKHGDMPFNLRSFEDENKARLGAGECVNHKLIDAFQILYEKHGEFVAQYKFTVLLMPTGTHRITGLPFEKEIYESTHQVSDPDAKAILAQSAHPKCAKRKKKKSEKAVSEVLAAEPMEVDA